ncbi:MAG TPA: aquaporin [Opitutaceae bacterium]|nr:aquaporin [Opitutaceae bacterium]
MKKYVVEFIGTFFLVFAIGCAVIAPGAGPLAPIAIGLTLMVMVYAGAHISGAHYNPAVTLAVWIRGKCPTSDILPYWVAQIAAAAAAAWVVHFFKQPAAPGPFIIGWKAAVLAEFVFTFGLGWVVMNTGTAKGTAGNSFYGLAIGMTVTAGAFAVGGISGAVFNPAVAVGITLMNLQAWSNLWIYLVADFAGAAAAAFAFKLLSNEAD